MDELDDSIKLEPPVDILRQLDEIYEFLGIENEVEEDHSYLPRPEILVTKEDSLDTEPQTDDLIAKLGEEKTVCDPKSQKARKTLEIGEKSAKLDSNKDVVCKKLTSRIDHPALISASQKNVKCDVCSHKFKISQFSLHKRSGPFKYLYQCDVCKEYCSSYNEVKIHVESHRTGLCTYTKMKVKTEYHGRRLGFFCGKCNVSFLGKLNLIQHLNTIHSKIISNPDGLTECHLCHLYFASRHLSKHLEKAHLISRDMHIPTSDLLARISSAIFVIQRLPDSTNSMKHIEMSHSSEGALKDLIGMAKNFQHLTKLINSFQQKKTPDSCAESTCSTTFDSSDNVITDQQVHASDPTRKIQTVPKISDRTSKQFAGVTECSRSSCVIPPDQQVQTSDLTRKIQAVSKISDRISKQFAGLTECGRSSRVIPTYQQVQTSDLTRKIQAVPKTNERTVKQIAGVTECSRSSRVIPTDQQVHTSDLTRKIRAVPKISVRTSKQFPGLTICSRFSRVIPMDPQVHTSDLTRKVRAVPKKRLRTSKQFAGLTECSRSSRVIPRDQQVHTSDLTRKILAVAQVSVRTTSKQFAGMTECSRSSRVIPTDQQVHPSDLTRKVQAVPKISARTYKQFAGLIECSSSSRVIPTEQQVHTSDLTRKIQAVPKIIVRTSKQFSGLTEYSRSSSVIPMNQQVQTSDLTRKIQDVLKISDRTSKQFAGLTECSRSSRVIPTNQQVQTCDLTRKIQAVPKINERTAERFTGLTECSHSSDVVSCVDMQDSTGNNIFDKQRYLAQLENAEINTLANASCSVWKCLSCDLFFGTQSNMLQHVRSAHKYNNYYSMVPIRRCPICMLFKVDLHSCDHVSKDNSVKWSQVYTAFKLWKGSGFFSCPFCRVLTGPISVLANHMNQVHRSNYNQLTNGENFLSSASAGCRNKRKCEKVWDLPKIVTIFQCKKCNLLLIEPQNHTYCRGQYCVMSEINLLNWLGLFSCPVCTFKNCSLYCVVKHMNTMHCKNGLKKISSQFVSTTADTRHTGSDLITAVVETAKVCNREKNAEEIECSDEHKEPSDIVVVVNCEGEDVKSCPKRPILQQTVSKSSRKRKVLNYCDMNSGRVAGKFVKAKLVPKRKRKPQLEKSQSAKEKSKTGKMRKAKGNAESLSVVPKRPTLPHPNAIIPRKRKKLNYSDMNSGTIDGKFFKAIFGQTKKQKPLLEKSRSAK